MARGQDKRGLILDIAQAAVLEKGFGATSIEEIIAAAGITKGGFFYHFRDKNALARALIERHMEEDDRILEGIFRRGRELSEDPLEAFLIGLRLLAEMLDGLPGGHPGCLVATYCYQERLFDREVRALNRQAVLAWRERFRGLLGEIADRYPPREPADLDDLADMVSTVVEGGIVMAKALGEPKVLARQVLLLRSAMRLLFRGGEVREAA